MGARNVAREIGWGAGAVVGAMDFTKGALAVRIVRMTGRSDAVQLAGGPGYYAVSPSEDPPGPRESVNWRVIRDGSLATAPRALRAANRFWAFPKRNDFDGFRCVADL